MKSNAQIAKEIKQALREADKLSDACQDAYSRGNTTEGDRLEEQFNLANHRYMDLVDANRELAPRGEE